MPRSLLQRQHVVAPAGGDERRASAATRWRRPAAGATAPRAAAGRRSRCARRTGPARTGARPIGSTRRARCGDVVETQAARQQREALDRRVRQDPRVLAAAAALSRDDLALAAGDARQAARHARGSRRAPSDARNTRIISARLCEPVRHPRPARGRAGRIPRARSAPATPAAAPASASRPLGIELASEHDARAAVVGGRLDHHAREQRLR